MAQRTVALCNGKYIGIETIYTVIDGKQINIPDKLKDLRQKSKNNELFCPCGCGANLILVAGDKNLREQHFRIKDGDDNYECQVVTEGKTSVDSKIVLKCWLDDNLHDDNLESRLPICDVSAAERRYEFTFISRKKGIALDYCHNRANLSDEKQSILEQNSNGIKIIHVVDSMNGECEGQYPEWMMKVQDKQRYCLLLAIVDEDYLKAEMKAVFYGQDIDGFWHEIEFANGPLKEYRIEDDGIIYFHDNFLESMLEDAELQFKNSMDDLKSKREEQKRLQEESKKQQKLEEEKRKEEQRIEVETAFKEKSQKEAEFKRNLSSNLDQQETQVRDADGNRWIKCEYCGNIAMEAEFATYGGLHHVNLGICKKCSTHNPAVKAAAAERRKELNNTEKAYDPNICPICGGKLKEKMGRNGRFIGCSNFPECRYTRSL